jgi:hypothetical protein
MNTDLGDEQPSGDWIQQQQQQQQQQMESFVG